MVQLPWPGSFDVPLGDSLGAESWMTQSAYPGTPNQSKQTSEQKQKVWHGIIEQLFGSVVQA